MSRIEIWETEDIVRHRAHRVGKIDKSLDVGVQMRVPVLAKQWVHRCLSAQRSLGQKDDWGGCMVR
nr:uncharacterized protein CI109_004212 [Kwoniella shandongensis]KAA5527399.1 hypothetical protein CI109_004212 [Kwoniella shandongensis]